MDRLHVVRRREGGLRTADGESNKEFVMRIGLKRAVFGLAIAASLALLGPAANASTPAPAAGAWAITITSESVSTRDSNTIIAFTFVETITGTVVGTRVGSGRLVIHPDGTLNAHDQGTFTGTVRGMAGSATATAEASGTISALTGHVVVGDGAGELGGVHGNFFIVGSASGLSSFSGTYTGQVH